MDEPERKPLPAETLHKQEDHREEAHTIKHISPWHRLRTHIPYLATLIIVNCILLFQYLIPRRVFGSEWRFHLIAFEVLKDALTNYHTLPFWVRSIDGGQLFFAIPDKASFYFPSWIAAFFGHPATAYNYNMILHLLAGAIVFYFFMLYLIKDKRIAFLSALIYSVSPIVLTSPIHWRLSFVWVPLVLWCLIKAFKSKEWLKFTAYAAMGHFMLFNSGNIFLFYYFSVLILLPTFIYYTLYKKKGIPNRLLKLFLIGTVFALLFVGLSAAKILPTTEWLQYTNRAGGLEESESLKKPLMFSNVISWMIYDFNHDKFTSFGIIVLFLALSAIFYYRRTKDKETLLFLILFAVTILFAWGVGKHFFYQYLPGLKLQRELTRALWVLPVVIPVLAGYGLKFWWEKISHWKMSWTKNNKVVLAVFFIILMVNLIFLTNFLDRRPIEPDYYEDIFENNKIWPYIAEQEGMPFRAKVHEVNGIDFTNAQFATVPLKIDMLYNGLGAFWLPEYFYNFLGLMFQDQSKILGIFNVKYLTSGEELNLTNWKFVKKFPEYEKAYPDFVDGPYLYENEQWLPRAYLAKHSILVLGQHDRVQQIVAALILEGTFNSTTTVVFEGDKLEVEQYSLDFLEQFDAILFTEGSITGNSNSIVQKYKDAGGVIMPDFIEGENTLTIQSLQGLLNSLTTPYSPIEITEYAPNRIDMVLPENASGFLTISEKFHLFDGWECFIDGKKKTMYRANFIVSGITSEEGAKTAYCEYTSPLFRTGLIITLLTALIIILILCRPWLKEV